MLRNALLGLAIVAGATAAQAGPLALDDGQLDRMTAGSLLSDWSGTIGVGNEGNRNIGLGNAGNRNIGIDNRGSRNIGIDNRGSRNIGIGLRGSGQIGIGFGFAIGGED